MKTYTYDEVHAELMNDLAFREAWDQEAFARAVSIEVLRYRIERDMTQEQLAAHIGTHIDVVSVLEDGEETPSLDTLVLLSDRLGLKFAITIAPPDTPAALPARIVGAVAAASGRATQNWLPFICARFSAEVSRERLASRRGRRAE